MINSSLSCNVAVAGQFLHCPAELIVGLQDGEVVFGGILQWGGRPLIDTVKEADVGMAEQVGGYVRELFPACSQGELSVLHQKNITTVSLQETGKVFRLAMAADGVALLFTFQSGCSQGKDTHTLELLQKIEKVADFFGVRDFFFYAQTGKQWLLPVLMQGGMSFTDMPIPVRDSRFLVYAHFVMNGNSVFVRAVKTLFSLEETDLFFGAGQDGFSCMLTIPAFHNDIMQSENLYIMVQLGKALSFVLKGDFIFNLLPAMRFRVDCGVGSDGFEIAALAHVEAPVRLFEPFCIGDTCLMIRMSSRITFGLYTSLYIRNLQLFGAVMLSIQGQAVVPELLSAAVSDLSIPILLDNLIGEHIAGIDALGFIKILGLPFQNMQPFPREVLEKKDIPAIVGLFNRQVTNPALQLDASQVQLTPFGDGMDVTDLKRMRHYYINLAGSLQLTAQFYYSKIRTTFGNYTVEQGLFICGVLELFGKRFEVLFSFREGEGIVAYAKIPNIDLGFLKIKPSQIEKKEEALPIAKNSILSQFLNPSQEGLVFFLEAGKKNVSFYLDGHIELLALFCVDARIIFCKGLISIDLRTVWLSILQVSLHLQVDYQSFSSANFEFCFMIDTSKLTEKLTAVTKKIDEAIGRLRSKISNANREIDRAKEHVNELYRQIDNLNNKIADCRNAIRNASWWKKAFVAIAKGIEIGAYEVAKVGVYAAIGVANAALEVAKGIVNLGGKIGEGVLKAVQGVIQGAMSLFYLHYIKLQAKANREEQYFQAEIEFVALGKTYHLETQIGKKALEASPEEAVSGPINNKIQPDLDHIEDGAFRSNWRKYQFENEKADRQCRRLEEAKQYMASSVCLMQSMQNAYVDEFQTPMEEFDEMNVSLVDAMGDVENILSAGMQAGNVKELSQSMGGLKRSVAAKERDGIFREDELRPTKELIAAYDEARIFYDKVADSLQEVKKHQKSMQKHCEHLKENTVAQAGKVVVEGTEGDVGHLLLQVEEQMYDNFPVDRSGTDFINLSREPLIQECFAQAEKIHGKIPSQQIQHMRNRSRKGRYISRL